MRNIKVSLKKIEELRKYYLENPIDDKFPQIIKNEIGIDLKARYGNFELIHPVLIAPGQLTREAFQIKMIKEAGYSGCVLKSVVGEDEKGNCSMLNQRKKMTYLKTVYDEEDNPVIQWDGRGDTRNLEEYLKFAKTSFNFSDKNFLIVSSILCHLPGPEEFKKDEWIYTTKKLYHIGYRFFEIDFCPSLKIEKKIEKENILRWYREIPMFLKNEFPDIYVFPKILNLEYGIDFQLEIIKSAIEGNSDGVVIGNRIFKEEFNSAYGGKELRERNLIQIKEAKREFPDISISGTGGVYEGRHIFDYLKAGADNVQILSYILGKAKKGFLKKKGNKFEKVIYELFFNPVNGLLNFYRNSPFRC
jgi:hypothetical protein